MTTLEKIDEQIEKLQFLCETLACNPSIQVKAVQATSLFVDYFEALFDNEDFRSKVNDSEAAENLLNTLIEAAEKIEKLRDL